MTQKGKSVTLTLYSSPEGRYHWGGGCPYGQSLWGVRVRRLWCPGSEGSEGSACLWQAGSKGGGIALRAMSFIARLAGTGLHWRPPPPPLRGPPPPASGGRQGLRAWSSPPCYLPPFPGVGGERSETEGGGPAELRADSSQRSRSMPFPYLSAMFIVFFIFLFQHIAFGFSMAHAVFFQIHALQFRGEAGEDVGGFCEIQEVV